LLKLLQKTIKDVSQHITVDCELCKAKGYLCEVSRLRPTGRAAAEWLHRLLLLDELTLRFAKVLSLSFLSKTRRADVSVCTECSHRNGH
jgi:hypothetical protein